MRKKDWADEIAEKMQDEFIGHHDDDLYIVERIANQLRAAFYGGLEQKQMGVTTNTAGNGDTSHYVCTAPRNPSGKQAERENQQLKYEIENASGYKLTWDGNASEKGERGKGKKKKVSKSHE